MKYSYFLLVAAALFISCNSGQKQAQAPETEFNEMAEEIALRDMVKEVYDQVNARYNDSYEPADDNEPTLEQLYTTEDYQAMYDSLHEIEQQMIQAGRPNDTFFAEGGNVWLMGSHDFPFTTQVARVEFDGSSKADVYFWLEPAESANIPILWQMKKVDGKWLIQNFIVGDENYGDYDYTENMKDYIKRNSK